MNLNLKNKLIMVTEGSEEIANTIAFPNSGKLRHTTGKVIYVNVDNLI